MLIQQVDGRYRLQQWLGDGRFADVYLAEDSLDRQLVVVKILKEENLARHHMAEAFKTEVTLLNIMQGHPYVVKMLDHGTHWNNMSPYPYIVLQSLYGQKEDLVQILNQRGAMLEEDIMPILCQYCMVLLGAHYYNIAYRDAKPEHVFWDGYTVTLIDWNVSRIVPVQEQREFQKDIFDLGALAYHMLTGQAAAGSSAVVRLRSRRADEVDHQQFVEGRDGIPWPISFGAYENIVSSQLRQIIERALHIDLNQRYTSAVEMYTTLLKHMEELESKPSANLLTLQGKQAIRDIEYQKAIILLEQSLEEDPDDSETMRLLTWTRLARKAIFRHNGSC